MSVVSMVLNENKQLGYKHTQLHSSEHTMSAGDQLSDASTGAVTNQQLESTCTDLLTQRWTHLTFYTVSQKMHQL